MLSEFCTVQWLLVLVCVQLQRLVLTTLKEQSYQVFPNTEFDDSAGNVLMVFTS